MAHERRWDPCIEHRGNETDAFLAEYFSDIERDVLVIAGAGFDPRATALCRRLFPIVPKLRLLLIQEERPNPAAGLVARASANIAAMQALGVNMAVCQIDIVDQDNAVVGGRNLAKVIASENLHQPTDVVVDVSAMSVGISFPLIRFLVENRDMGRGPANIHLIVNQDAALDESIVPQPVDAPNFIHGFRGRSGLDATEGAAKLWLPQLAKGRKPALQRLYEFIVPHDTCPILPFPSARPRLSDELAEHYLVELESTWSVDPRNLVYAAEDDPLDLYRTVLRIHDLRQKVFEATGGSLLVLSPTGSKLLSMGALMAALERDLPVVYLEAIGYDFDGGPQTSTKQHQGDFIHIWLEGDAYPTPRVALKGRVSL